MNALTTRPSQAQLTALASPTLRWLAASYNTYESQFCGTVSMARMPITCVDGFRMSAQAGQNNYSSPRQDGVLVYTAVECGFPTASIPDTISAPNADGIEVTMEDCMEYGETGDQTKNIFPWTPVALVDEVIAYHGGLHIRCQEIIHANEALDQQTHSNLLKQYEVEIEKVWKSEAEAAKVSEPVTIRRVRKAPAPEVTTEKPTWDKFKRTYAEVFFGCVDKHGNWFDSAESFQLAIHWCCCKYGITDKNIMQEACWFEEQAPAEGLSIIHSTMLRKMYEAGLIN